MHLATHSKADNENGDLSFILFGETDSTKLYAKNIYEIPLAADMVVLSACQTSAGPIHRGEGVMSLARSFIYAGASSVITSLWNVREESNNEIILKFYENIKEGMPKGSGTQRC